MPIIPLLQSKPLADAPKPVLDREKRPTVNNGQLATAVGQLAESSKQPLLPAEALSEPYRALGAVGRAIQQTGDAVSAMELKRREAQTFIQVSDAETEMEKVLGEQRTWQESNPNVDPEKWADALKQRFSALRGQLSERGLNPQARLRVDASLRATEAKAFNDTKLHAAKETYHRAETRIEGGIFNAIEEQNPDKLNTLIVEGRDKLGTMWDHKAEYYLRRFEEVGKQKAKEKKAELFSNAQNSVLTVAAGSGEAAAMDYIEAQPDLEPSSKERLKADARQVVRQKKQDIMGFFALGIADGSISDDSQIEGLDNPHWDDAMRKEAKGMLRQSNLEMEATDRRDNGTKNAVVAFQEAREYDPGNDPTQKQLFGLLTKINRTVPAESREVIEAALRERAGGNVVKLKPNDEVMKNLRTTVANFYDPVTGAIPYKRKEWKEVEVRDKITGEPLKEWQQIEVEDEAARTRAMDAQTRVMMQLEEHAKQHPEDFQSLDKIKKKFVELLPEGAMGAALNELDKLLKPQASAGGVRTPVGKVTSYGYPTDETPDSNSSAGIGAFVPSDEAAKIKRGESSDFKLRAGDLAVSPDIEQAFRGAGIKPGGEVMVQLATGEIRKVRWMDKTAQDEDIAAGKVKGVTKPLRGRFDFYSPRGKNISDGTNVIGWWPVS